jgi:hypothetical protein
MPGTATITAKAGPGLTVTAQVFPGLSYFSINTDTKIIELVSNGITKQLDINAATTYTLTVSAGVYTLTIS